MAKPRIPNQKKQYRMLDRRLAAYMAAVRRIYAELSSEAAKIVTSSGYDGKKPFSWRDYPNTKARMRKLQERFVSQLSGLIMSGTSDEWKRSNLQQDLIVNRVLKAYHTSRDDGKNEKYYRNNEEALRAFQTRREQGMNISNKLWDQSQAYREELQDVISVAIERGTDAVTLSKQISKYLRDFPSMQRDYKDKYGRASKAQNCEFRSIRLARSEINMAYRSAEQERWRQLDFVVGYEIKMSGAHPAHDVCDSLAGKYPKDFRWLGWHPNCYTDKAMVLTNNGWKHFSDVESTDAILSLNPDTRDVEWVKFVARQCYPYSGKMIRFFNKSLECVVTQEHQMVYLSKTRGDIRKMSAIYYRKGNGAFYRTCEHRNPEEKQSIEINGDVWSFDDYCEFMGYWLADGSTQHTTGVALCQKKGEPAWDGMISCLERLGYHYTINEETISFYRSNIVRYLKQFGNAYNKFIPVEILSASKRQMQIFLDAFIKCDGYTRKTKSFVGNRGNVFSSKNDERMYFTTSPHLAGDLCQLLIMLGKRPSFKIKEPVIITKKDGSIIKGNYPCFVISECLSGTATVFDKEMVDYSGNVYDLTLEKNHIMYISYDGKCFWGSNCMCYEVPILKTEDEFYSEEDKPSTNEVTDVPEEFKDWCTENWQRIENSRHNDTLPYFLSDNRQYVKEQLTIERATELRHANRDEKAILHAWENRQALKQNYGVSLPNLRRKAEYWGVDTSALDEYVYSDRLHLDEYGEDERLEALMTNIAAEVSVRAETARSRFDRVRKLRTELNAAKGAYHFDDIIAELDKYLAEHNPRAGEMVYGSRYEATKVGDISEFIRQQQQRIEKRRDVLHSVNESLISSKLGVEKMVPMSFEEADELRGNPMFLSGLDEYTCNCQSCVVANELRRRGYDVEAQPNYAIPHSPQFILSFDTRSIWVDRKTGLPPVAERISLRGIEDVELANAIMDKIKTQGRYNLSVTWENPNKNGEKYGHVFTIERKRNGTIFAYDPQTGEMDRVDYSLLLEYLLQVDRSRSVVLYRIDNCDVNTQYLDKIVKKK